jgi:hypothetical protein
MNHLQELLLLVEPLDVTQTPTHCLNVVFTLQGLRYNTNAMIGQRLEMARLDWQRLSAAELHSYLEIAGEQPATCRRF